MAKKGREAMRAKAKRLAGEVDQKTDSSNWSPSEPLNANVKTGMRPVSKSKFKKGGKVTGAASVKHAGRRGRKAGGRLVEDERGEAKAVAIAKMNRDQKEANESREGIKHEGGLKHGGRAKKAVGGMPTDMLKKGINAMLTGMKKGGTVKRRGHANGAPVDDIGELIKTLPQPPSAAASAASPSAASKNKDEIGEIIKALPPEPTPAAPPPPQPAPRFNMKRATPAPKKPPAPPVPSSSLLKRSIG